MATAMTLGLSAMKIAREGSRRLRNCASVSVAKTSSPGVSRESMRMMAIGSGFLRAFVADDVLLDFLEEVVGEDEFVEGLV